MFRTRRLTSDDIFQPLGDLVLAGVVVVFAAILAAAILLSLVCVGVLNGFEWLQEQRFLGPIAFAVLVVLVLLRLTGCATPPDPRDPLIWRPTAPASYPLPK